MTLADAMSAKTSLKSSEKHFYVKIKKYLSGQHRREIRSKNNIRAKR
jgi:hypothetical protein